MVGGAEQSTGVLTNIAGTQHNHYQLSSPLTFSRVADELCSIHGRLNLAVAVAPACSEVVAARRQLHPVAAHLHNRSSDAGFGTNAHAQPSAQLYG